jgi:hypothetical protein
MRRRSGFVEALNPYIRNIADMTSNYFLLEGERKRKAEEEKQRVDSENNLLGQLFPQGTYRDPNKRKTSDDLYNGVYNSGLPFNAKYSVMEGLQPKTQKQRTVRMGGNIYIEDPNIEGKPIGDPIFSAPKEPEIFEGSEFVPAEEIDGLKSYKGYTVKRQVFKDKDGNIIRRGTTNEPFKRTYADGGGKDKTPKLIDIDDYKKTLAVFTRKESENTKNIDKYKIKQGSNTAVGFYGNNLNKQADEDEVVFYNNLLPEAKKFVDENFYNQDVIKNGERDQYQDREDLAKNVDEMAIEDFKAGKFEEVDLSRYKKPEGMSDIEWKRKISGEVLKSIQLWTKLKFRRL